MNTFALKQKYMLCFRGKAILWILIVKRICTQRLHLVVVVVVVGSLVECSGHEHNGFTSLDDVFAIPVDRMFDLLFTDSQMYLDFIKARKTFGPYTNHLPTIYVFITCCDVMLSWLQIYRRSRGHRKWMVKRIKCATSATHSLSTTPSVPRRRPPPKSRCAHPLLEYCKTARNTLSLVSTLILFVVA